MSSAFDFQPDDQVIAKGQQIGLMIFSSDRNFTLQPEPGTVLTIDLDATQLTLPVVGAEEQIRISFLTFDRSNFASGVIKIRCLST